MSHYETLGNRNASEGLQVLFIYVSDIVPIFIPLVLFAFFSILTLGTYFAQVRSRGSANILVSLTVAGFVTTGLAILFSLVTGLIAPTIVITCMMISLIFTIALLFTKEK